MSPIVSELYNIAGSFDSPLKQATNALWLAFGPDYWSFSREA
jgi:hypothetical protein